jgi:hypothetical protein
VADLADQFIQNGGNILILQKILGSFKPVMTMRYAHSAPAHLADAVRLPRSSWTSWGSTRAGSWCSHAASGWLVWFPQL